MKKFFKSFALIAAAAMALAACQKEVSVEKRGEDGLYKYSFNVVDGEAKVDAETKAVIEADHVAWVSGDQAGIFIGTTPNYARMDVSTTPVKAILYSTSTIAAGTKAYGYYPYSADNASNTPDAAKIHFATIQHGAETSAMPMAALPFEVETAIDPKATSGNGELKFMNLGSVIVFKVWSSNTDEQTENVQYITLDGDQPMSGDFYLDLTGVSADEESTLGLTVMDQENDIECYAKVEQTAAVADSKANATEIKLVVAPGTYSATLKIGTDAHTYYFELENKTFNRSGVRTFGVNLANAISKDEVDLESLKLPVEESFASEMGAFSVDNVTLPDGITSVWEQKSGYVAASAYKDGTRYAVVSRLVSPWINLQNEESALLTFENAYNYLTDTAGPAGFFSLWVKTDEADWAQLDVELDYGTGSFSYATNEVDLSAYLGHDIKIAFQYTSDGTTTGTGTWDIKNFVVDIVKADPEIEYPDGKDYFEIVLNSEGYSEFTAPELSNPHDLTVTYSSSNEEVAVVDETTGEILLSAAGTAVITATFEGNNLYKPGTASYTVKVIDPNQTSVTDVITLSTTGVTGTSYTAWSGKTVSSDAVYAGQSAGGNDAIQLRSTSNNSGIITTASGGTLKSVSVEWNSNTAEGRVLNVYGKNTAYADAADLYNESNQGVLLGTITNGTSTTLAISGTYTFIGIRSNSGAMYLDAVEIEWSTAPVVIEEYDVTINPSSNGTVTADPVKAAVGTTVTLTVSPDPGYALASLTVDGLTVTDDVVNNEYAFVMPEHNVAVTATFEEGQSAKTYTITWNSNNNSDAIANYTSEWTVTSDGLTCNMVNWNNNSNGWNYVKAGRKNNESVATISTASAIPEAIKTVTLTIDAVTASKINSLTLSVAADKAFTNATEYSFNVATGDQVVTIPAPAANMYYRITADCASGSSNGLITVSKLAFATN